jgi:hypothetical protein
MIICAGAPSLAMAIQATRNLLSKRHGTRYDQIVSDQVGVGEKC